MDYQKKIELLLWATEVTVSSKHSSMTLNGDFLTAVLSPVNRQMLEQLTDFNVSGIDSKDLARIHKLLKGGNPGPAKLIFKIRKRLAKAVSWKDFYDCFSLVRWLQVAYPKVDRFGQANFTSADPFLEETTESLLYQVMDEMSSKHPSKVKQLLIEADLKVSPFKGLQSLRVNQQEFDEVTPPPGSVVFLTHKVLRQMPPGDLPQLQYRYLAQRNLVEAPLKTLSAIRAEDVPAHHLELVAGSYLVLTDPAETSQEFLSTLAVLTETILLESSKGISITWEQHWVAALQRAVVSARAL